MGGEICQKMEFKPFPLELNTGEYASNALMYALFINCFAIEIIQILKIMILKNDINRHCNTYTKASTLN